MIYPDNFEQKTGIDRIRALISSRCHCSLGKKKNEAARFISDYELLQKRLGLSHEFILLIRSSENIPLGFFFDVTEELQRIRLDGTYISQEILFDFYRSMTTIRQLVRMIKNLNPSVYPHLKELASHVNYFPVLLDRVENILTSDGRIKDHASPELKHIRAAIHETGAQISAELRKVLSAARNEGLVAPDAELTVRNGRLVIPVERSVRRKIEGYIHDESSSGKTVFIEPASVVELNNRLRELEFAETREIIKILTHISIEIRPYIDDLLMAFDFLGTIDYLHALASFSMDIHAIRPVLVDEPCGDWINAVHPLLFLLHRSEGKEVVPHTLQFSRENRILLISGPNAGGKSVLLQLVAILQYMVQCGMPVPVAEGSVMGIFKSLFLAMGDEQSIDNDLSTYSSHLLRMNYFLRHSDEHTLVLIDELGSGTEPVLGGALAEAILEELNDKGCFGVITTHYSNLKQYAASAKGIQNAAMLFDTLNLKPLYQLRIGEPGSSFAFEIARQSGIPDEVLKRAEKKAGTVNLEFERNVQDIVRNKAHWENLKKDVLQEKEQLKQLTEKLNHELSCLQQERKEIIKKAKQDAAELLSNANRTIENTIRKIKESQAGREKTREARKEMEETAKIIAGQTEADPSLELRLIHLKQTRDNSIENRPVQFAPGDIVTVRGHTLPGTVVSIRNDVATVEINNSLMYVECARLERTEKDGVQRCPGLHNYDLLSVKMRFKPEIDLRGKRSNEAIEKVRRLIDEAVMTGHSTLRILHGKGDGILRHVIREYLRTEKVVKKFYDESEQFGGSGITLVELDL